MSVVLELGDIRNQGGLCGWCLHAILRPTRRGTLYLRCGLAARDGKFPKYPRLPVTRCEGHEPVGDR